MEQTLTTMTKYNPANIQAYDGVSNNTDVAGIDSVLFEERAPWLQRFGVLITRCCHPNYSLWIVACSSLVLFCSPRNKRIWLDLNDHTIRNKIRRLFELPEIWIGRAF
jgi:hypothetical protein